MTPEQVRALSDTELNIEMLNIHIDCWQADKDILRAVQSGKFNYLEDYNLTMPLVVKGGLTYGISCCASGYDVRAIYQSVCGSITSDYCPTLLRAYCEVLVLIKYQ